MTNKPEGPTPAELIDGRIADLGDWRGELLVTIRALIKSVDPDIEEAWKWRGVPVWEHAGMVCTGETYRDKVKITFAHGASLDDPTGVFNSSLDGGTRRAVDYFSADDVDAPALRKLLEDAIALNEAKRKK